MTASSRRILVVGIGNRYRCDDGVGAYVVERVSSRGGPEVATLEHSGEGASLMEAWAGSELVVVIDAARSGSPPGTIHRFDALTGPIPTRFFNYSTHAFSVAEAVEMGRALDTLPPGLILYGIEGAEFGSGTQLTASVQTAADRVVDHIMEDLANAALAS